MPNGRRRPREHRSTPAPSGAIGLAAAQTRRNFSIWAVHVIGRAGCQHITSTRAVSLLPSHRVISTVTGTRAFRGLGIFSVRFRPLRLGRGPESKYRLGYPRSTRPPH